MSHISPFLEAGAIQDSDYAENLSFAGACVSRILALVSRWFIYVCGDTRSGHGDGTCSI